MAYGEKYYHTYCDSYGNNFRISILQRDFVGESIELEGQPNPFLKTYENSDDFKFKPIVPSRVEINLIFGTKNGVDFEEFWTSDEKSFKVEHYRNNNLDWIGFVVPNGFDYEFRGGLYYASIIAADGLSTLESFLFKDENSNQFYWLQDLNYNNGEQFPFILIATLILRKLELDIDVWSLVDLYEQSMTDRNSDSRNSDPLAISYVNIKTYINDSEREDIAYFEDVNEAWNCSKVLENLLYIWGCKLYQEGGVWRIKRVTVDSKYGFGFPKQIENKYWYKAFKSEITIAGEVCDKQYTISKDLYSIDSPLVPGSKVENVIGSGIAEPGFYKLFSLGIIVSVLSNSKIGFVFNCGSPVYYWHKYNTLAGYIGREEINDSVIIPCKDKSTFLLGNDHVMRMDEVYKQFRVNYGYTFIREGDSPVNLVKNGSFSQNYNQYGGIEAPPNWQRWSIQGKWLPRLRVDALSNSDKLNSGGYDYGLIMGQQYNNIKTKNTDPNPAVWAALLQKGINFDSGVKSVKLNISVKYKVQSTNREVTYFPVFRAVMSDAEGNDAFLLNGDDGNNLVWEVTSDYIDITDKFFILDAQKEETYKPGEYDAYKWYQFSVDIPEPPFLGDLSFYIHGICATKGRISDSYEPFRVQWYDGNSVARRTLPTVRKDWIDDGGDIPRPIFTGIKIAYIPDPGEEVPSSDYIYANENINYTDQREPIEVFNGDTVSNEIISSITVPTNNTGNKNKWDTSSNDFGKSDIGLIQAKAIMSQYNKPFRLLEGSLKANNIGYGSRFEFEALPNIQFILLRSTFNTIKGYLEDATFAQISSDSIAKGGIINGNSLDPIWISTGNFRCLKDDNGENTGQAEYEEIDSNSNSETFGDYRWLFSGQNLSLCPIGEPSKYYWGTDSSGYDLDNFKDYTIKFEENKIIQVNFDNEGGNYIYFLHLASLGIVNRVANNYQYNIISSFQYLADVTINGYLYRVLRQDFVTAEFKDFTLIFDFN